MTKREVVVASTRHHCARLLKYYPRPPCPPSFVKSRIFRPLQTHFLLFQQIFFVLVCIHAGTPRVPPRVLASRPKPCGGNYGTYWLKNILYNKFKVNFSENYTQSFILRAVDNLKSYQSTCWQVRLYDHIAQHLSDFPTHSFYATHHSLQYNSYCFQKIQYLSSNNWVNFSLTWFCRCKHLQKIKSMLKINKS